MNADERAAARLRAVVPTDPTATMPSCPGWTVADLTRHVGEVYLHKTLAIASELGTTTVIARRLLDHAGLTPPPRPG